jgi:hypothetical protein
MLFQKKPTPVVKPVDPVVEATKKRTHKAAADAQKGADRLNKVFAQNGITLNILRMAGKGHHGR